MKKAVLAILMCASAHGVWGLPGDEPSLIPPLSPVPAMPWVSVGTLLKDLEAMTLKITVKPGNVWVELDLKGMYAAPDEQIIEMSFYKAPKARVELGPASLKVKLGCDMTVDDLSKMAKDLKKYGKETYATDNASSSAELDRTISLGPRYRLPLISLKSFVDYVGEAVQIYYKGAGLDMDFSLKGPPELKDDYIKLCSNVSLGGMTCTVWQDTKPPQSAQTRQSIPALSSVSTASPAGSMPSSTVMPSSIPVAQHVTPTAQTDISTAQFSSLEEIVSSEVSVQPASVHMGEVETLVKGVQSIFLKIGVNSEGASTKVQGVSLGQVWGRLDWKDLWQTDPGEVCSIKFYRGLDPAAAVEPPFYGEIEISVDFDGDTHAAWEAALKVDCGEQVPSSSSDTAEIDKIVSLGARSNLPMSSIGTLMGHLEEAVKASYEGAFLSADFAITGPSVLRHLYVDKCKVGFGGHINVSWKTSSDLC